MPDSFFAAFTRRSRQQASAGAWFSHDMYARQAAWLEQAVRWPDDGGADRAFLKSDGVSNWFNDQALQAAAEELHRLATQEGLRKRGLIMKDVSSEAVNAAGLPAVQSPMQQAAHKTMHFLGVGAPPVFIALLTPWVWLGWSFSLYLETASSVVAGLGLCTMATTGIITRKRRLALARQRYAALTPEQQGRAVTIDQALDALDNRGRQFGDAEIAARIQHITQAIRSVLPVLVSGTGADAELYYTVRQTAFDYLPATLDAYQQIPTDAARADHEPAQSPRQLLLDQLSLIEANIGHLVGQVTENGRQVLQANGRFLEERFRLPHAPVHGELPSPDAE